MLILGTPSQCQTWGCCCPLSPDWSLGCGKGLLRQLWCSCHQVLCLCRSSTSGKCQGGASSGRAAAEPWADTVWAQPGWVAWFVLWTNINIMVAKWPTERRNECFQDRKWGLEAIANLKQNSTSCRLLLEGSTNMISLQRNSRNQECCLTSGILLKEKQRQHLNARGANFKMCVHVPHSSLLQVWDLPADEKLLGMSSFMMLRIWPKLIEQYKGWHFTFKAKRFRF